MNSGVGYSLLNTTPQPLSPDSQDVTSKMWASEACSIKVPESTGWPREASYRQSLLVGEGFPVRGGIGFLSEQA